MSKLKGMRTYLSGAMDRVKDGGVEWRAYLTPILQGMGVGVLNPCDKPTDFAKESGDTRARINQFKKEGNFDEVKSIINPICHVDLRMCDECSFLICYIDTDVHAAGTYHELTVCIQQRKPTLLVVKQGKENCPNWWFGVIPHQFIFSSFEEMLEYLKRVDKDEDVKDLNRWLFFDYNKVYGVKE